jgi:predicted esterase
MGKEMALTMYEIKPLKKHEFTVIFMHGLGDNGRGWCDGFRGYREMFPSTKWIFPNAKERKVTRFNGEM